MIGESGVEKQVEELVQPVRDVFAAVFFVAVGMLINPALIAEHLGAVVALTAIVVVGKIVAVSLAVFLTGQGTRLAIQSGMSLAQIGEFSFIIAGVGVELSATRDYLYPVAVAVSAVTTLLTPWLIRASGPVASFVDRKLPKPIQTFTALYGTWLTQLGSSPERITVGAMARRLARLLIVDALLTGAVVIGASMAGGRVVDYLRDATRLSERGGWVLVVVAAVVVAGPFWLGILRNARALGRLLGNAAMPAPGSGRTDIADAPRRAFVATLQVLILLLVGTPLVAATQPFLPPFQGAAVLVVVLAIFTVLFWRTTANLQAHARAGAEVIVEALAAQARAPDGDGDPLAQVHALLPGLGDPVPRAPAPRQSRGRPHAREPRRARTHRRDGAGHRPQRRRRAGAHRQGDAAGRRRAGGGRRAGRRRRRARPARRRPTCHPRRSTVSHRRPASSQGDPMYDQILYEVAEPAAIITLNRPKQLNAWTDRMGAEVKHALAQAEADKRVVAIILTGAGRGFCAGADMFLLQGDQRGRQRRADPGRARRREPGRSHHGRRLPRHLHVPAVDPEARSSPP